MELTLLGLWRRSARRVRQHLPQFNFITLHYSYFIATCLICAVIFWGSSTPAKTISFTDSLFFAVSGMSEAGLNTVNLSDLNSFQQSILFVLIIIGSSIFVSASVVHVRRRAFETRFRSEIAREQKLNAGGSWLRRTRRSLSRSRTEETKDQDDVPEDQSTRAESDDLPQPGPVEASQTPELAIAPAPQNSSNQMSASSDVSTTAGPSLPPDTEPHQDRITFSDDTRFRGRRRSRENNPVLGHLLSMQGVGARSNKSVRRMTFQDPRSSSQDHRPRAANDNGVTLNEERSGRHDAFLPSSGFIGRNSNFHDLTEADRNRLGGSEYKAVVFLSWVVPIYCFVWQFLGCLSLGAYVNRYYSDICRQNGLNPWWVGAFNAVSAFNNSGMSLLDANMVAFNYSIFMLVSMGIFILAGNTCYPVFLRLFVWTLRKVLPDNDDWSDTRYTLKFLLDHPRRCYTNLFPSQHTWWLFLSVVILNGIDCAAFAILNIGNKKITDFPPGIEFINGLFQAFAVRSGGFYVVPIPTVRISLQVLYVIMMYISVYPISISIRNSNVYEERSLGIYSDEDDPAYALLEKSGVGPLSWLKSRFSAPGQEQTNLYFVQHQLRVQLAHDLWWLVLAVFLIMIIEGGQFEKRPDVFSVFNVIFEVVSGYGTVGISVGLPDQAYSFSGAWHKLSKLILCAVMLRGRHRGLPVAIDKAVLLPRDHLSTLEEEDARIRRASETRDRVSGKADAVPPV